MKNDDAKPEFIQDAILYFKECGVDNIPVATKWYHEMNAIGWMIGKHKIVNWKSAASVYILQLLEANPSIVKAGNRKTFINDEVEEMMRKHEAQQ